MPGSLDGTEAHDETRPDSIVTQRSGFRDIIRTFRETNEYLQLKGPVNQKTP